MSKQTIAGLLHETKPQEHASPKLREGSRVAVMGAGPAGSFFATFLLDMAGRIDLSLQVDLYEPRDFSRPGPTGCNMDAGIISETLIQHLAAEGIRLPPEVIQEGIDTYLLHTDAGDAWIEAPLKEKRIASVFRGSGPAGSNTSSFDGFCLSMAQEKGARLIPKRIEGVSRTADGWLIQTRGAEPAPADLLVVATGVNANALRLFPPLEPAYRPPVAIRGMVREYRLGAEAVTAALGSALHVFLLDIPGLDFAAIVPKGDWATICILGPDITDETFETFLASPQVRQAMPPDWKPDQRICHCAPRMQVEGAIQPYGERLVFVGDSGVSRLYKDGIGAAYRTAKAAARTALFYGIGRGDFKGHYWPVCRAIANDNRLGKVIFTASHRIQTSPFAQSALLETVRDEQSKPVVERGTSGILWDTFTGSAPYRDILGRMLDPVYAGKTTWYLAKRVLHTSVTGDQRCGKPKPRRAWRQHDSQTGVNNVQT